MSDHAWALKNGDMDQVKELVDGKVDSRTEKWRRFVPGFASQRIMIRALIKCLGSGCKC